MLAPHGMSPGAMTSFELGSKLPTLMGSGLELRALGREHAEDLYRVFADEEVVRYWSRTAFNSMAQVHGYLDEIDAGFASRTLFQWGVVEAGSTRVVGTCTLFNFDRDGWRCELGFALARDCWGRGVARRAVTAVLELAFGQLGVHRVEADADPRNERCLRVLERLGFQREGLLRERYNIGN
jgi:ribosomal-protein-alanine N-acetyltransferase